MSDTVKILLFLYLSGYVIAFLLTTILVLPGVFSFNSVQQKNTRLLLMRNTVFGRTEEYDEPSPPSFKKTLTEFGLFSVILLFNSLLSWLQVAITGISLIKAFISWVFTPSSIKLYRWKIKHVEFQRAEDFIALTKEAGLGVNSDHLIKKGLEELSQKSEALTRAYAEKVFNGDEKEVEDYVSRSRQLTKEQNDSVVIHPRFWAITQNKYIAQSAVGRWNNYE